MERYRKDLNPDFSTILITLSEVASNALTTTALLKDQLSVVVNSVRIQKEKALHSLHNSDTAFHACLADNNKIRKKFGLEPVFAAKFSGEAPQEESRSIISYARTEDIFFDAEEGADEDLSSDDSSEAYSMHDANEHTIIDDDSDEASRGSSMLALNEPLKPRTVSRGCPPAPASEDNLRLKPSLSTQSRTIIRRCKLPVPATSMENISILGILRNNVGKDLSTVAMPIALNEPINLLQKLCEEVSINTNG